jgi:hypothetical protein
VELEYCRFFPMFKLRRCILCNRSDNNRKMCGELHVLDDIVVDYDCFFYSSDIEQNGNNNDEIEGFLLNDIRQECRRAEQHECFYCHRPGATIHCCQSWCRRCFHLPCGIRRDTFHDVAAGEHRSYCHQHPPGEEGGPNLPLYSWDPYGEH